MVDKNSSEKLEAALTMIMTIESTLATLYAKTAQSTSFGDQSRTLASINELEKSRALWKHEAEALKQAVAGSRKTLKIQFR